MPIGPVFNISRFCYLRYLRIALKENEIVESLDRNASYLLHPPAAVRKL
jgi:hypothetical protein